jgi:hypothetical protein
MHTEQPSNPPSNPDVTYEKTDAHPRPLYQFLFWISVTCVVTAVFSWFTLEGLKKWRAGATSERALMAPPQDRSEPPAPRIQTREALDLEAFKKEEAEVLTTYGVVDKEHGLFRIPIEEAMKLTVSRGLPVRGEEQKTPPSARAEKAAVK